MIEALKHQFFPFLSKKRKSPFFLKNYGELAFFSYVEKKDERWIFAKEHVCEKLRDELQPIFWINT